MICSSNKAGLHGHRKLEDDSNNDNSKSIYQALFIITCIIASISERHQAVLGSSRVILHVVYIQKEIRNIRIVLSLHVNLSAPVPVTTDHGPVHDLAH